MSSYQQIDKIRRQVHLLSGSVRGVESLLAGAYDPEKEALREHYKCFKNFVQDFWPYCGVSQSDKFMSGWHTDAICDHLQALYEGEMNYLLIATVPRVGKSTIGLVAFFAWIWAMEPSLRFLTFSYVYRLTIRDNQAFQQCIQSPLYQHLWGKDFYFTKANREETYNSVGGTRICGVVGGSATGNGGNIIAIDDANDISKIYTKGALEKPNNWFSTVVTSRQNDLNFQRWLIQQQRSHQEDFFNYIRSLELPNTVTLVLPMEYELGYKCSTIVLPGTDVIWEDPRTKEGELLAPQQFSEKAVSELKRDKGLAIYNAQYQQRPSPLKGLVFERSWFKVWRNQALPEFDMIIQGWDTAISLEMTAAQSASTVWGLFKHPNTGVPQLMLLQTWYDRLEWTDLRKMMMQQMDNFMETDLGRVSGSRYEPDLVLVEAKANGSSLISSLRDAGYGKIIAYDPQYTGKKKAGQDLRTERGKIQRARLMAPLVENGRIWLQGKPPLFQKPYAFAEEFLEAVCNFPNHAKKHSDVIDTFTMVVNYLDYKKHLYHEDYHPKESLPYQPIIRKSF